MHLPECQTHSQDLSGTDGAGDQKGGDNHGSPAGTKCIHALHTYL